nr:hypothetical protein HK105_002273 [Polyrhizophydium stewartii]
MLEIAKPAVASALAAASALSAKVGDLLPLRLLSSPRVQLIAAAAGGGIAMLCAVWLGGVARKRSVLRRLKAELSEQLAFHDHAPAHALSPDAEALVKEQLSRNIAFLGEEVCACVGGSAGVGGADARSQGVAKCRRAFVVVVGVGGVGSHAAHMLLRAGIGRIRLIDFDQVTLSSLNRHAVARRADVGTFKVVAMQRHFAEIMPHAVVEPVVELFTGEAADRLLGGNPDFVLDCIDNLATKVDLLKYCHHHGIPVISSMGAGAKADASRIQIADISETFEDPLARSTRKMLRLNEIERGITVVYSTEKPTNIKLVPLVEEQLDNPNEYAPLPHFRSRILPVLGTIPALFGNAMASYVLTEIGGFQTDPLPVKSRRKTTDKLFNDLLKHEREQGRGVLSGAAAEKLVVVRWDSTRPAEPCNLVCMTKTEAGRHQDVPQDKLEAVYGAEVIAKVQKQFALERRLRKWRGE